MDLWPLAVGLLTTEAAPEAPARPPRRRHVREDPTDQFEELHVVFTEVLALRGVDDAQGPGQASEMGTRPGDEWSTLVQRESGIDVDLLDIRKAAQVLLGGSGLEPGQYSQIIINVKTAYGVANGKNIDLPVQGGTLKIVRPFRVDADKETRLILEMDPRRSLQQSEDGTWMLAPVIGKTHVHVVADEPDVSLPRTAPVPLPPFLMTRSATG